MMITVPLYNYTVLTSYFDLQKQENLAKEIKCSGLTFELRRAWIYIELAGFLANIVQLCVYLVEEHMEQQLLSCCKRNPNDDIVSVVAYDKTRRAVVRISPVLTWDFD